MSQEYLALVSVGPVQEFISEARKVRDLWIGSQLLSLMTRKALEYLSPHGDGIIVPVRVRSHSEYACVPNRFIARTNLEQLQNLAGKGSSPIPETWRQICDKARERSGVELDSDSLRLWDFQLHDLWQLMWVAIPVSDTDLQSDYSAKVQQLQQALESRKATRTFDAWVGSHAFKCSQCGKREAMGPAKRSENRKFWREVARNPAGQVRDGDSLCAVCLVKRFVAAEALGLDEPKFASTADVAVQSFKEALKARPDAGEVKRLQAAINGLLPLLGRKGIGENNIDAIPGVLLFAEELRPQSLVKEFFPWLQRNGPGFENKARELKEQAQNVQKCLGDIRETLGIEPSKYYVLFQMDGDHMGEYMSHVENVTEQRDKSKLLGELATEIPDELSGRGWRTVYSGGDDVLAMGPLEDALAVALTAARRFRQKLPGRTASAGMVITHYHNPLRKALQMLRENVEDAKEVYGRDALVTTVWLASGTAYTCGHKWDMVEQSMLPALSWMKRGLSPAFVHDVLEELDAFYHEDGTQFETQMFLDYAGRLFKRHLPPGDNADTEGERFLQKLATVAYPDNVRALARSGEDVMQVFADSLRVIPFMHRERVEKGAGKRTCGE